MCKREMSNSRDSYTVIVVRRTDLPLCARCLAFVSRMYGLRARIFTGGESLVGPFGSKGLLNPSTIPSD